MSDHIIPHSRPSIIGSDIKAVSSVLESGQIAQGPGVVKFEKQFSDFIGKKETAATSSGTAALHLALLSLGVKEGDEVIVPSFVCAAVLNAVLYTGATPFIADIDPGTYNISVDAVKGAITQKTKAVIVPHMFGDPVDGVEQIVDYGVPVIEDCALSIGASINGRKVGSFADVAIFSFSTTSFCSFFSLP